MEQIIRSLLSIGSFKPVSNKPTNVLDLDPSRMLITLYQNSTLPCILCQMPDKKLQDNLIKRYIYIYV